MSIKKVWAIYFSPTGGTEGIVKKVAGQMASELGVELSELNFTSPKSRSMAYSFTDEDLVVIGSPTYAGRIPNKIMPDFKKCFKGDHTFAVPVTVFGNRSYGCALTELRLILQENGFCPVGAASIVTRHTFSQKIATDRPNAEDEKDIVEFCTGIASKIKENASFEAMWLDENTELDPYYTPLKQDLTPAKFLPAKPVTDVEKCTQCGICAKVCPMGSIDSEDITQVPGICIKCHACIRRCPNQAKHFVNEDYLSHLQMLEENYMRKTDNCFLGHC